MTNVLHITVEVPLPDEMFAQADTLAGIQPALTQFEQALPEAATITTKVTSKRQRKAKDEAQAPAQS
jgi:hypothetical protein